MLCRPFGILRKQISLRGTLGAETMKVEQVGAVLARQAELVARQVEAQFPFCSAHLQEEYTFFFLGTPHIYRWHTWPVLAWRRL